MRKMIKILNIALLLLISCCVSAGAAENSSDAKTTGLKLVSLKDQIPDSNNMQVESVDLENNWVIEDGNITFLRRGTFPVRVYGERADGNYGCSELWMSVGGKTA